ncbi:MAG: hypothetical protein Q9184_002905 [Pyrenodesmia sp. 2 TL-2023]
MTSTQADMPRKKNVGPAAHTKRCRDTRKARRGEASRQDDTEWKNSPSNLFNKVSFEEDKIAGFTAREKIMDREPREPVGTGDRADLDDEPVDFDDGPEEVEEPIAEGLIQMQPERNLINYKMVYMVDPNHRLLILRFPNRRPDQEFADVNRNKPLELRIKPKYGFVELDVPITFMSDRDAFKADNIQRAMMQSAIIQKGGSYGMAGGFGVNEEPALTKKTKGKAKDSARTEDIAPPDPEQLGPWEFNKITLSGMIQRYDDTKPRLMAGVFKGNVLYLSHIDAVVELTVSFQHVDALSDLEKTAARYQRDTKEARDSERERQIALQQAEAKAVHVAVKSAEPDEGMPEGRSKIKEMLQEFADEPWQRMKWTDHDDPDSYRAFDEHFGLNKDPEVLPDLVSTMNPRDYLDSISCPRYDHTLNRYRQMTFPTTNKRGKFMKVKDFKVDENGKITSYSDDEDEEEESDRDEDEHGDEYGGDEDGEEEDGDGEYDSGEDVTGSDCKSDTSWETVSEGAHL